MKLIAFSVAGAVGLLACSSARCETWRATSVGADLANFLETSGELRSGSTARAWILEVFAIPQWDDSRNVWYQSIDQLEEYDCSSRKVKHSTTVEYSIEMNQIANDPAETGWMDIIPGSYAETNYEAVCLGKFVYDSKLTYDGAQAAEKAYLSFREKQMKTETPGTIP